MDGEGKNILLWMLGGLMAVLHTAGFTWIGTVNKQQKENDGKLSAHSERIVRLETQWSEIQKFMARIEQKLDQQLREENP